jgi:hypothetical protein
LYVLPIQLFSVILFSDKSAHWRIPHGLWFFGWLWDGFDQPIGVSSMIWFADVRMG